MNAEAPEFSVPKRYHGKVKTFNAQKGFGFIECDETMALYARDVFLHQRQAMEAGVKEGMACHFEVDINNKGQPQARNVQAASPSEMPYTAPPWSAPAYAQGMGAYSHMGGGMWGGWGDAAGYGSPYPGESMEVEHTRYQLLEHIKQIGDPASLQSLLSSYANSFQKDHMVAVAALYRLATIQAWSQGQQPVSVAPFLSCIFAFEPELKSFSPLEAGQVLWSFNRLEASSGKERAFAMKLCQVVNDDSNDVRCGYKKFTPAEMVAFMSELSRLIRNSTDDTLIGEVIDKYSAWGLGESSSEGKAVTPRWTPKELSVWTDYLAGTQSSAPPQQQGAMPMQQAMHPAAWQQQMQQYGGCCPGAYGCPPQQGMGGPPSWKGGQGMPGGMQKGMGGPGGPAPSKGGYQTQQMCGGGMMGGGGGKGGNMYGGKGQYGGPGMYHNGR